MEISIVPPHIASQYPAGSVVRLSDILKDQVAAWQRKYREDHKDQLAARQRKYREDHKDQVVSVP